MHLYYLISPIIASGIALLLLIIILIKGKSHPASRIFSLILIMSIFWGIFIFLMRRSPDAEHALVWDRAAIPFSFSTFILYYHFALKVTNTQNKKYKIILNTAYLITALILALSQTGFVVQKLILQEYGYAPIIGLGAYIIYPFGTLLMILAFYLLFKTAREAQNYESKNRLRWISFAMIFFVVGSFLETFPGIAPTAIISNIIFCLIAGFAILRYHLFDIRIILKKGLAYLLIISIVTMPYVCIFTIANWALGNKNIPTWILLIPLTLLAFSVNPLWKLVKRRVDRVLYGKRYSSLTALERFSRECTGIIDLESLSSHLISLTLPAMGASSAHLLMSHGKDMSFSLIASSTTDKNTVIDLNHQSILVRWLEKHDAPLRRSDIDYISPLDAVTSKERDLLNNLNTDLLVPFKYSERLNGILILSPKASTDEYTNDDLSSLMVLARHASTAIENARLYAQSQEMAIRDGVTGFYNHSFFQERARAEIEQAKRFNVPVSLLIMNIDLFHIYNEIHGHAEGDKSLAEMAEVIRSVTRETDLLFRYSGDEFAMLAPGLQCNEAYKLAEQMRKAVEVHTFSSSIIGKGFLTISIGIVGYPEQVEDSETLAFCAELALIESKRKGRNTVSIYTSIEAAEKSSFEHQYKQEGSPKTSQLPYISTILALAAALDAKDPFTYGHSQKVAKYAVLLGEAIGFDPERLSALRTAALLHDIGKIGIPDNLLLKPQRFNTEERIEIQKHAVLAASILKHIPSLSKLLPHIVHHHERFDGTGYPDKLIGEDIPLESRILSIADSYDAMTSPRPYKPTLADKEAVAEVQRCAGTQFDPKLAKVFCEVLEFSSDISDANN